MSRRERAPWVALALFLVPTYVDHARVLDRGDSTHYYSYLRSLLFDGDLQLANDYELLGWPEAAALPNVLPIGAPLLWSPLIVVVHLLRQAARLLRPRRAQRHRARVPGDGRVRHAAVRHGRPSSS